MSREGVAYDGPARLAKLRQVAEERVFVLELGDRPPAGRVEIRLGQQGAGAGVELGVGPGTAPMLPAVPMSGRETRGLINALTAALAHDAPPPP